MGSQSTGRDWVTKHHHHLKQVKFIMCQLHFNKTIIFLCCPFSPFRSWLRQRLYKEDFPDHTS